MGSTDAHAAGEREQLEDDEEKVVGEIAELWETSFNGRGRGVVFTPSPRAREHWEGPDGATAVTRWSRQQAAGARVSGGAGRHGRHDR